MIPLIIIVICVILLPVQGEVDRRLALLAVIAFAILAMALT